MSNPFFVGGGNGGGGNGGGGGGGKGGGGGGDDDGGGGKSLFHSFKLMFCFISAGQLPIVLLSEISWNVVRL